MRPLGAPPGCTATARSILHALQPSRPRVLPSSHSSPLTRSTTPLPHVSFDVQSAEQPSPAVVLLSSQTSPRAVSMISSPQRASVQFDRHCWFGRSLFATPRSHCSPKASSTIESPHFWRTHVVRHVAFGRFESSPPLSHCSLLTTSITPLPPVSFDRQSAEQPSPAVSFPSSHCSPFVLSTIRSPQRCGWQFVRHVMFGRFELFVPRSHASPSTVSVIASPHTGSLQVGRHAAFGALELPAPASHCSPVLASTILLPQVSIDLQSAEQPSPARLLPSSQTSLCVTSTMRSPHRCS